MNNAMSAATTVACLELDLPAVAEALTVYLIEDRIEDGFGLVRTGASPSVEIAVAHDGSDSGLNNAADLARLVRLSPVILALVIEALDAWRTQFDGEDDTSLSVSSADFVDWFAQWRVRVRQSLAVTEDTPFQRALRSRVHDPEEAMSLAASHRRQAAEARMSIPAGIDSFYDQSRALGLEQRAAKHEKIATVCEQHAAGLAQRPL